MNEFGANYVFVANSADDPNAAREEKIVKTPEAEVEKAPEKRVNYLVKIFFQLPGYSSPFFLVRSFATTTDLQI